MTAPKFTVGMEVRLDPALGRGNTAIVTSVAPVDLWGGKTVRLGLVAEDGHRFAAVTHGVVDDADDEDGEDT